MPSKPVPEPVPQDDRIDLRIPMWNIAVLILFATGMAAINLYTSPGLGARVLTSGAGIAALITAVIAYRMYLVADADGVGLRTKRRTYSIPWAEVADIGIIEKRKTTSMRLQIELTDGQVVDIPQSLTAPGKPESKPVARKKLAELGRKILDYPQDHPINR